MLARGSAITSAAALLAAGCASYTPTIAKEDKPTGKEAYLYGRFHISSPVTRLAMQGHQRMGFSLKCADDSTYTIKFDRDEPLQVVRIAPSSCAMSEILYSDADGFIKGRKPAPDTLKKAVTYEAGKAYYLGDFYAEARQFPGGGNMHHWTWRVTNVTNDYRQTTDKLKSAFPNLSELPTENRIIGR